MPSLRALRHLPSYLPKPRTVPRSQIRLQHDKPHKYYFQDKDFVPPSPGPPFRPGPSLRTRFIRSSAWSLLGLTLGFATLNSLATYSWLQIDYTPGDEFDTVYLAAIQKRMDNDPMSRLLATDPEWSLMQGLEPDGLDRCLRGSCGVMARHWFNPSKASMVVMIHFGEGTEAWPQQVHAGILASYVHNAMTLMAPTCFPPPEPVASYDASGWRELMDSGYYYPDKFQITFDQVVASGEVYCIWICPAFVFGENLYDHFDSLDEQSLIPKVKREDARRTLMGTLIQSDRFPYQPDDGGRFQHYANAVGKFEKVVVVEPRKPVQLTMDGKLI